MQFLTYTEVAKLIGKECAYITMQVKRQKLIADEVNKKIDIDDPQNSQWLAKTKLKQNTALASKPTAGKTPKLGDAYSNEYSELVIAKARQELKNLQNKDKLETIKIQKLNGELIPYAETMNVFLYTVNVLRSTYLQEVNSLASVFKERLGANHEQFIEVQKELRERINTLSKDLKKNLLSGLEDLAMEFSDVREQGEKK